MWEGLVLLYRNFLFKGPYCRELWDVETVSIPCEILSKILILVNWWTLVVIELKLDSKYKRCKKKKNK